MSQDWGERQYVDIPGEGTYPPGYPASNNEIKNVELGHLLRENQRSVIDKPVEFEK